MNVTTRVVKADQGVEILVDCQFQAGIDEVFAFFADHSKLRHVFGGSIERTTDAAGDDPNGLGSVRTIKLGPGPSFDERIERYEPPHRIEYTITRGSPVKNHYGNMQFEAEGDKLTRMHYSIRLQSKLPGTSGLVGKVMAGVLSKGLPKAEQLILAG